MMKKWIVGLMTILLLLLVACSDPESSDKVESEMSADEVYEKSMEQVDTLESAAFNMKLDQTMDMGGEDKVTTKADVTGEMIEDPFIVNKDGSVTMESETVGKMEINIEMYAQDDVVYVYEDMFNNWMKGTMDDLGDIGLEIGEEQSPFSPIEDLEQYIEEFTFEQTNDTYDFTLETDQEKFKELIVEKLQGMQMQVDGSEDISDVFEIDKLHYDFSIDKETFNMLAFTIDFDITITENNETATVESVIEAEFSDFNTIEEITIPEEVIDEAVEPNDAFGF